MGICAADTEPSTGLLDHDPVEGVWRKPIAGGCEFVRRGVGRVIAGRICQSKEVRSWPIIRARVDWIPCRVQRYGWIHAVWISRVNADFPQRGVIPASAKRPGVPGPAADFDVGVVRLSCIADRTGGRCGVGGGGDSAGADDVDCRDTVVPCGAADAAGDARCARRWCWCCRCRR